MHNPSFVGTPTCVPKGNHGDQVRRFASLKIRVACVEQGLNLLVGCEKFNASKQAQAGHLLPPTQSVKLPVEFHRNPLSWSGAYVLNDDMKYAAVERKIHDDFGPVTIFRRRGCSSFFR